MNIKKNNDVPESARDRVECFTRRWEVSDNVFLTWLAETLGVNCSKSRGLQQIMIQSRSKRDISIGAIEYHVSLDTDVQNQEGEWRTASSTRRSPHVDPSLA